MNVRLDHIALNCKNLSESIQFYQTFFDGKPGAVRKAGDGHNFCFINMSGAAAVQLIETGEGGINHYGFVTDDVDSAAAELKQKGAKIIREIRDGGGKLTTLFVEDCNGLKMEVRIPR
jgi:predicted enzyme related to lactoylglutathione lyase